MIQGHDIRCEDPEPCNPFLFKNSNGAKDFIMGILWWMNPFIIVWKENYKSVSAVYKWDLKGATKTGRIIYRRTS